MASTKTGTGSSGGTWEEYKAVKIDIHQTMVIADHAPDLGKPEPGAIRFMKMCQTRGYFIWLSCGGFRGSSTEFKAKVTKWLKSYGLDTQQIGFMPDNRYIIDISDRAVQFDGNWNKIQVETQKRMDSLERTKDPDIR